MDNCINEILEIFYKKTGIVYKNKEEILKKKIVKFYKDLNYCDCYNFLDDLKFSTELFQHFTNFMTVSESYFFRETKHFEYLIKLLKNSKKRRFKILSLPCSSGEEPYTILIYLLENGIKDFDIVGADINTNVLEIAKTAIYPLRRLSYISKDILDKYFEKVKNYYLFKDEYKKNILFKHTNLFDKTIFSIGKFDFIFSRNLFIYFDDLQKKRALEIFYKLLNIDGYLFLGHADNVREIKGFKKIKELDSQILKKIKI